MLIWMLRLYTITHQMKLDIKLTRDLLSYVMLYLQATLLVFYSYNLTGYLIQIGLVIAIFILYSKDLLGIVKKLVNRAMNKS